MPPFGPWPGEEVIGGWPGPNQNLATQAAWFLVPTATAAFPVVGSDGNDGKTAATALLTRSELARRMFGVSLTQGINITVASSLLAGDDRVPFIIGNVQNGWSANWIGVPTAIVAGGGVITGYVARNGAGSQVTQMTIAGLPNTFTALGLINKVVEWTDGAGHFVRGVIVADLEPLLGTRTAWVSPPLNENNVQGSVFTNGTTVNFWSNPDFRTPVCVGPFNTYSYLSVGPTSRWAPYWGRNDLTSCGGGVLGNTNGTCTLTNHANGNPGAAFRTNLSGRNLVVGGWHDLIVVGGNTTLNAHTTLTAVEVENGSYFGSGGQTGTPADVEFNGGAVLPCIEMTSPAGGRASFQGFVYGTSANAVLARCNTRDQLISFSKQPNVTNAVNAVFSLQGTTELVSRLTGVNGVSLYDNFGNRIIGPAGAQLEVDRYQIQLAARAVIAETCLMSQSGNFTTISSGVAYFCGVGLRAGDIITNLSIVIQAGGTVMTYSKVGLYDKNGVQLAISADQGASWQAVGLKTIALTAPFTVPTSDIYYCAILAIGTTQPVVVRGGIATAVPSHQLAGGVSQYYFQTGLAALPTPAVYAVGATNNNGQYWFELS